jgi:hypothetical protein
MPKGKKTYTVCMCRTGYGFAEYKVEAPNLRKAQQAAYDEAGSHDYSEKSSEYTIDTITESR